MSNFQSDKRAIEIQTFLDSVGWGEAVRHPVLGDASSRRYERLVNDGMRAVLMDAPRSEAVSKDSHGARPEDRQSRGYNAQARLAGDNIESFPTIAQALTMRGFSAPHILAADLEKGLLLLEDLGAALYANVIADDPRRETLLYETAIDTLAALYRSSFPTHLEFQSAVWTLQDYDETALCAEMSLCLDWFSKDSEREISARARENFYALWKTAFKVLHTQAPGLALRDFHAENLFWLPERKAIARVGLIDFQDALFVHPAYDVVSLIEDIRRDVNPDLTQTLVARFCDQAGVRNDADFRAAYAVLGGQRNTKLLGFPVRADLKFGKPQYRALLPRVKRHFENSLRHAVLADVRIWFETYLPEALEV